MPKWKLGRAEPRERIALARRASMLPEHYVTSEFIACIYLLTFELVHPLGLNHQTLALAKQVFLGLYIVVV